MVDRDRGSRDRGSRDEAPRGRREENVRSGRDDPPARGGRDRDDDRQRSPERGGRDSRSSGSSSRYSYQARTKEDTEKRANQGASDFDRYVKEGVKLWTPAKGDNTIRILPPTWEGARHYGFDIYVHYGVGADRGTYLDLDKMLGKPDPITEEWAELKRKGGSEEDIRELAAKKRVGYYIIDRDDEGEGVQFWPAPWGIDKDLSIVSQDKQTGEVLAIDHPEEGYDVEFRRDGEGLKTKYTGVSIARRSSPLGKVAWLDYAVDNPIPDILQYFTYEEIAKAFGGGGAHRERDSDEKDDADDRGTARGGRNRDDRDDDRPAARGRDDRGSDRGGREDRSADEGRRERGGRDRDRAVEEPALTFESVQEMTSEELDALCESDDRLKDIDPSKAVDDDELKEWICEDLKLEKLPANTRRRITAAPETKGDPEAGDKLAEMRSRRERR